MDDLSSDEMNRMIEALRANADALGRITVNRGNADSSGDKASLASIKAGMKAMDGHVKMLNGHISKVSGLIGTLGGSVEDLTSGFKSLLRDGVLGMLGGGIVAEIITAGEGLTKTYKQMSEIGQTFGGDMLEMGKAAGAAGLPLDEFATMLRRNSVVAAQLAHTSGTTDVSLGALQKGVRANLEQFGMFGMSLDEIADVTGSFSDTMRIAGTSAYRNKQAMTDQITKFATDISEWSYLTGKDRKELSENAQSILKDQTLNAVKLSETQQNAINSVSVAMAGAPKEIGVGIAETVGLLKSGLGAANSNFMQTLMKGGGGALQPAFEAVARKIQSGAADSVDASVDALKKMQSMGNNDRYMAQLNAYATAGNADAERLRDMIIEVRAMDLKDWKRKREEAKKHEEASQNMLLIENSMSNLSGSFRESFYDSLKDAKLDDIFGDLKKDGGDKMMKTLTDSIKGIGTTLGSIIPDLLRNLIPVVKEFGDWLKETVAWMHTDEFQKEFKDFKDGFAAVSRFFLGAIGKLKDGFFELNNGINSVLKFFGIDSPLSKGLVAVSTGIIALGGALFAKNIVGGFLKNVFGDLTRKVDIKAGVVNVNGPSSGGGSNFDLGGGKGAAAAEKEAEELAKGAGGKKGLLSRIGSSLSKGMGSMLKGNKLTSSLLNFGQSYLAEKSGSAVTGRLMSGASWLSKGIGSFGSWAGKGIAGAASRVGGIAKGAGKGVANMASTVGGYAKGIFGGIMKKAFGPILGVAIAASQYGPEIWEAYNLFKGGQLSGKDFTQILLNTVGPIAVSAGAGFLGEATIAAGSAAGPIGAAVGGAAAFAVGMGAEKLNKKLFNQDYVQSTLATARAKKTAPATPKPMSQTELQSEYDAESRATATDRQNDRATEQFYKNGGSKDQVLLMQHNELLKKIEEHMARLTAITQQAAQQNIKLQTDQLRVVKNQG